MEGHIVNQNENDLEGKRLCSAETDVEKVIWLFGNQVKEW